MLPLFTNFTFYTWLFNELSYPISSSDALMNKKHSALKLAQECTLIFKSALKFYVNEKCVLIMYIYKASPVVKSFVNRK